MTNDIFSQNYIVDLLKVKSILHFATSDQMKCSSDLENLPRSGRPRKRNNRSGLESRSGGCVSYYTVGALISIGVNIDSQNILTF